MSPDSKPDNAEGDLDAALDKHLCDPAEITEQVSGDQERARRVDQSPTEPGVTTEQQPT